MNRSHSFNAYVLVDRGGKVPILSGEVPVFWTLTAAEGRAEEQKNGGHDFTIERVKIVRSKKRARSLPNGERGGAA